MKVDKIRLLEKEIETLKLELDKLSLKLARSNSAFLNIVGKNLDGIVILDKNKTVLYANYSAIKLLERNIADLLGEPLDLAFDLNTATEITIQHSDGATLSYEVTVFQTEWNNELSFLASFRDITERKKSVALEYISEHDYLTDLPNRVGFEKKMQISIQKAKENEEHMALLYLDLDNFKVVNDTLGHEVGDLLLKKVAVVLRKSIRKIDTVARLGGDEFAIILSGLRRPDYARAIAQNILSRLSVTFDLNGKEIFTNASIGIAVYPLAGKDSVELTKNADAAMYFAKKNGRNQCRVFSEQLNEENEEKLKILNGLRNILHKGELFLCYQPIIDLHTSDYFGVEVLVRWNHPQLGLVSPDRFLPAAEESGMMVDIGHWILEKSLADYGKAGLAPMFLSINLSANELDAAAIAESILKAIQKQKINPKHIILELTETSVMRHPDLAIKKLKRLTDLGIQIAIDDYGTGYSSLSYLKRLPISILKIDKSFIEDIATESHGSIIVKSTIQLAHNLGLKVIAEGAETKEQVDFLKKYHCDYVQGFYFAKPMPIEKIKKPKLKGKI